MEPFLYISSGQALCYALTRLQSDAIDGVIDLYIHYTTLSKLAYMKKAQITEGVQPSDIPASCMQKKTAPPIHPLHNSE